MKLRSLVLAGAVTVGTTIGALIVTAAPSASSGSNTVFAGSIGGTSGGSGLNTDLSAGTGSEGAGFGLDAALVSSGCISGDGGVSGISSCGSGGGAFGWNAELRTDAGTRERGGETGTL